MCSAPVGRGAKRTRMSARTATPLLIGAHVSPAGGPAKAVARGVGARLRRDPDLQPEPAGLEADGLPRRGGRGLPRARSRARPSRRCSSTPSTCSTAPPRTTRSARSRSTSLTASLQAGRRARARVGVVLHPGLGEDGRRRRRRSRARARSSARRWPRARAAPLHLENTAGAGGTLGRSLRASSPRCIEAAGGDERLGLCLDSLPPLRLAASTCAPPRAWRRCSTTASRASGLERLGSLHLNDSQVALGLQPRPARRRRAGRTRRRRLRRVPLRAALRRPALHPGDAGPRPGGHDRDGALRRAAQARRGGAPAGLGAHPAG